MKILTTLSLAVAMLAVAPAATQAQNAKEIRAKLMKDDQPAILATYNAPEKVLEDAIEEKFDKANFGKRRSTKGYSYWREVSWPDISPDKLDVYVKVEGRKDQSTITMLVSKGYDNFVSSASDADMTQKLMAFLQSFTADVERYQLRVDISGAEQVLKDRERDYSNEVSDTKNLEEDVKKAQRKLEDNRKEEADKQGARDEAKKKLDELKARM